LEIEWSDAQSRASKVEAKLLTEDNQIMLADLSIIDPGNRAWFEKKIIREHDA
jgi:hypothetical protein